MARTINCVLLYCISSEYCILLRQSIFVILKCFELVLYTCSTILLEGTCNLHYLFNTGALGTYLNFIFELVFLCPPSGPVLKMQGQKYPHPSICRHVPAIAVFLSDDFLILYVSGNKSTIVLFQILKITSLYL